MLDRRVLRAIVLSPFLSCLATAAVLAGCGVPFEDADALADPDGKADGVSRPLGAYRPYDDGALGLAVLVVRDDRTFLLLRADGESARGAVRYASSGSRRYLRLHEGDGQGPILERFAYRFTDGELELRRVDTSAWARLFVDPNGVCGAPDDCAHQGLSGPGCGEWRWDCDAAMCAPVCTQSSCLFGMYFFDLPANGPVALGDPVTLTAADAGALTEIERAQIVAALHASAHTDVTTVEEAFAAVDGGEILRQPLRVEAGAREFVAWRYWAGDNVYGAIFASDGSTPVALIQDGELHECTVAQ